MTPISKHNLDFRTGSEVIAEIHRLRSGSYAKTKNWNLTQICEHLIATMTGGMDGFGFRLPWILRATIIKWIFNRMLKTRKMSSGPTMDRLKPKTANGPDDDAIIDECIATIKRAEAFEGPIEDYPLLNEPRRGLRGPSIEVLQYGDEAVGEIQANGQGKLFIPVVKLRPRVTWVSEGEPIREEYYQIYRRAHAECFTANSVSTEIRIETE